MKMSLKSHSSLIKSKLPYLLLNLLVIFFIFILQNQGKVTYMERYLLLTALTLACAHSGGTYIKIGTTQRILALPLPKFVVVA